jgi:hypothetical protein
VSVSVIIDKGLFNQSCKLNSVNDELIQDFLKLETFVLFADSHVFAHWPKGFCLSILFLRNLR